MNAAVYNWRIKNTREAEISFINKTDPPLPQQAESSQTGNSAQLRLKTISSTTVVSMYQHV